ncbi:hypothetical protein ACNKHX_18820 [Shigella flexneri]
MIGLGPVAYGVRMLPRPIASADHQAEHRQRDSGIASAAAIIMVRGRRYRRGAGEKVAQQF